MKAARSVESGCCGFFFEVKLTSFDLKTFLEMSAMKKHSKDSAALFVLVAVSLALITILSVRKLKQFKYRLINEPGGAMFYGK